MQVSQIAVLAQVGLVVDRLATRTVHPIPDVVPARGAKPEDTFLHLL
jgi:hypothetical protein